MGMKIDQVLRYTAFLLVLSVFSQTMAFARKPLDGTVAREKIAAIGEGQQCLVKLVDGTKAKGIIVSIHADNFTLKTKGVEEPRRIDYVQVTGVHKAGMTDAKAAMTIGIATAGVAIALFWWVMYEWTHS
jgi:hypothetical protein